MRTLFINIQQLVQVRAGQDSIQKVAGQHMDQLPIIENAWLLVDNGLIHSYGQMVDYEEVSADTVVDASGRLLLPSWVDSHTHLVFAGPREQEFVHRIKGMTYEEIAAKGGGILNSANLLANTSIEDLYASSAARLEQVMQTGTGAIEIKSGYGLSVEAELKMLRVVRLLQQRYDLPIKATLLAAHAYPMAYKQDKPAYVRLIIDEILPKVAEEGLAEYMDVFCEKGFFDVPETSELLIAAKQYGLKPKIHANQLHYSGGVQVGVQHHAISVDHLECIGEEEINCLLQSETMPTILPGAAFFLGIQYQPARKMIDAGLPICIASDYNPGSCPSGNIPQMLTLACTQLKMTPAEAINAVTLNAAIALELEGSMGSITVGKKANLILTNKMTSYNYIPYDYGNNPVYKFYINGKEVIKEGSVK